MRWTVAVGTHWPALGAKKPRLGSLTTALSARRKRDGQADAAFMRYVEFRPGFAAWSNLQRARDHVDFFEANLETVANHHQSTSTTVLHMALASPEMTAFVLDLGADGLLEARTRPGEEGREAGLTPLQMAARRGYEATVRLLIERGAVFDVFTAAVIDDMVRLSAARDDELGTVDHYGASPLHRAAMYGGAETVSLLLDRSLAIDDENDFGETPLALAGSRRDTTCPQRRIARR